MSDLRIVYAGDRDVSVWVLQYLLDQSVSPQVLLLSDYDRASHAADLRNLCDYLPDNAVFVGQSFQETSTLNLLSRLNPDYIICVHFPYIIPKAVLDIPKHGVLNLHPAYLPYNRGWHTPSWALLEQTPIGATLHFMDEGLDTGDIIYQKLLVPNLGDTAHELYTKLKWLELEVFREAWPAILAKNYTRISQHQEVGTVHKRKELLSPDIQEINLGEMQLTGDLLRRLRALTTNDISEAAYFYDNGKRYRVQVKIVEE